jgi:hypothetical protein
MAESSQGSEDIEENLFFLSLKKDFKSLYANASRNCYIVCVPRTDLFGGSITREMAGLLVLARFSDL